MTAVPVRVSLGDVHYKYRSEDRSLILKWLTGPVFLPMVRRLPRQLTPNHVTLLGHLVVAASVVVALLAVWPMWVTLLALSVGYNAFNLADTLDGLYARDSGRASPRGELFDHGLDPVSLGGVVLTYGMVMGEPAWLILLSTATIAFVQFLTFLHGYRIGYVVLGEIGVIEGLLAAGGLCLAGSLGAHDWLTSAAFADVPVAGIVAIALVLGAFPALLSMRGLAAHLRDIVPLLLLYAAIAVWVRLGELDLTLTGLLIVFAAAYQSMIVTSSRLRRLPLRLWETPVLGCVAAGVLGSLALALNATPQAWLASIVLCCLAGRGAYLFCLTIRSAPPRVPQATAAS